MKTEQTISAQGLRIQIHYGQNYHDTVAIWRGRDGVVHREHGRDAGKRARRAIAGGAR